METLEMNHSEFPKFVFCIPPDYANLTSVYEENLWIYAAKITGNTSIIRPKFTPMVLDSGYSDGFGFGTDFAYCFRPDKPLYFYSILLKSIDIANVSCTGERNNYFDSDGTPCCKELCKHEECQYECFSSDLWPYYCYKETTYIPRLDPFLMIYLSFSNNPKNRFIDLARTIFLNQSATLLGCLEFVINDWQQNIINTSVDSKVWWEEQGLSEVPYNQAYCLDLCMQVAVLNRHPNNVEHR